MNKFSERDQEILTSMSFSWVEKDQEWYRDIRRRPDRVYYEEYSKTFVLVTQFWNDEDGLYEDNYEHFTSIVELRNYFV